MRRSRKPLCVVKAYRGFESLPLRLDGNGMTRLPAHPNAYRSRRPALARTSSFGSMARSRRTDTARPRAPVARRYHGGSGTTRSLVADRKHELDDLVAEHVRLRDRRPR